MQSVLIFLCVITPMLLAAVCYIVYKYLEKQKKMADEPIIPSNQLAYDGDYSLYN